MQVETNHRILIVSQTFPPAKGIGGRRWAKFAKYLKKAGCEIEVISADLRKSKNELWYDDVKEIKQYHYKHRYPAILSKNPRHIILKIAYRVALLRCKLKTKGTPYDRAIFDEKAYTTLLIERLNSFKPHVVIVSGPPFNLLYYTSKIRNQFKDIAFIADYRDPWLEGGLYGYNNLNSKALAIERAKEDDVFQSFDKIVSPWPKVLNDLAKRQPKHQNKISLLTHGWDKEDIQNNAKPIGGPDFIYGGNLYTGFEPLLAFLARKAYNDNIKIEIYSSTHVPSDILNKPGNFQIKNAIPVKDFFLRIRQSKYVLLLIPDMAKNGFPTKLLEFAATGKKILAIGYPGSLSKLIEDKGLGVFLGLNHLENFDTAVKGLSKKNPDIQWIRNHEMKNVTQVLLKIVEDLKSATSAGK